VKRLVNQILVQRTELCLLCNGRRPGGDALVKDQAATVLVCAYNPAYVCNLQIFAEDRVVMQDAKRKL